MNYLTTIPRSDDFKLTAQALAKHFGHCRKLTATTLLELPTEKGTFDLRVCGTAEESFFEWINEMGDPVGDIFDAISTDPRKEAQSFMAAVL